MFSNVKRLAVLGVALAALVLGTAPVKACEPCYCYKTVTCYEYVTVCETRCEAFTRAVTVYDHCGCPYTVYKTFYREVKVPVTKKVAVTKVVKVYY